VGLPHENVTTDVLSALVMLDQAEPCLVMTLLKEPAADPVIVTASAAGTDSRLTAKHTRDDHPVFDSFLCMYNNSSILP
jgi:hypothetical protein